MTDNFKMIINGREIQLPNEMSELFSQLMPPVVPMPEPKIVPRHIVKKVMHCKDTEARNVIIEINQRLIRIEKQLEEKSKPIKTKKVKPIITKNNIVKKVSKTKGTSKEKSKVKKKKIGNKKK